jgi:hypothetical protein
MQSTQVEFKIIYQFSNEAEMRFHATLHAAYIVIGNELINVMVVDEAQNQLLVVQQFQLLTKLSNRRGQLIQKVLLSLPWFETLKSKTEFIHLNHQFLLVPEVMLQSAPEIDWLGYMHNSTTVSKPISENVSNGIQLQWHDFQNDIEYINQFEKGMKHYHIAQKLITQSMKLFRKAIHIFLYENSVFACVSNGNIPLLLNSYSFENDDELCFWIMNLYQQFEINPETEPLNVLAGLDFDSVMHKNLLRFVRYVELKNYEDVNNELAIHEAFYHLLAEQ